MLRGNLQKRSSAVPGVSFERHSGDLWGALITKFQASCCNISARRINFSLAARAALIVVRWYACIIIAQNTVIGAHANSRSHACDDADGVSAPMCLRTSHARLHPPRCAKCEQPALLSRRIVRSLSFRCHPRYWLANAISVSRSLYSVPEIRECHRSIERSQVEMSDSIHPCHHRR